MRILLKYNIQIPFLMGNVHSKSRASQNIGEASQLNKASER
jgi:hypothetical protein